MGVAWRKGAPYPASTEGDLKYTPGHTHLQNHTPQWTNLVHYGQGLEK